MGWGRFVGLWIGIAAALGAQAAFCQEAADYFRQNCTSCHTIGGGRLTGPDLKDVTQRKDRQWLARFILDPGGVIAGGDAYAAAFNLRDARARVGR